MGTVLQCVDRRCDREGSFDAAVGQRPATVHEVTEGERCLKQGVGVEMGGFKMGGFKMGVWGEERGLLSPHRAIKSARVMLFL